jgi:hypothetical protein
VELAVPAVPVIVIDVEVSCGPVPLHPAANVATKISRDAANVKFQ